jgi:hypothetical protein
MRDLLPVAIAAILVFGVVILVGKKFRISSRYERSSRELNSWSALDHGIDPTEDEKK